MRYLKMKTDKHYSFSNKWPSSLIDKGFTIIPNLLIWNQGKLGITSSELVVICCLASHQWDHRLPFPATSTLARYTGKTNGSIKDNLRSLETKGYLRRIYRDGQTNQYDLKPLKETLKSYAQPIKKSTRHSQKNNTPPYQKIDTKEYPYKNIQRKRSDGYSGKPAIIGDIIQSRNSYYGQ